MEDAFQKSGVVYTRRVVVQMVNLETRITGGAQCIDSAQLRDLPRRPRVHWRIDISKGPFIGGNLAVRVPAIATRECESHRVGLHADLHVPFPQHEDQLPLTPLGINHRDRHAMESQVPGREPTANDTRELG